MGGGVAMAGDTHPIATDAVVATAVMRHVVVVGFMSVPQTCSGKMLWRYGERTSVR
jgi:hypothetical protein